jgi:hypothetical protein
MNQGHWQAEKRQSEGQDADGWVCLTSTLNSRDIMRMQWIAIVLFVGFSSSSMAAEQDYRLCTVGGYFSGTQDKFLSGLAAHIAEKKKIFGNPICNAAWENAFRIGEKLYKTGRVQDQAEGEIIHQAAAFSSKVYDAISARIDF